MEEAWCRQGVPYRLVGATRFYDRREIRDLLAWLKLVANPADDEAFRRAVAAPRRGIGETTIQALGARALELGVPMLEAGTDPAFAAGLRPSTRDALAAFAALVGRLREAAREAPVKEVLCDPVRAIGYEEHPAEGPGATDRIENVREPSPVPETVLDEGGEIS